MATVHFKLKSPNLKKKESLIYIVFNFKEGNENKLIKYSAGEKVLPKNWKQREQKSTYPELNHNLGLLREKAIKLIREGKTANVALSSFIKENWNKQEIVAEPVRSFNFMEKYDEYLKAAKVQFSPGTYKNKVSFKKHLLTFAKKYGIVLEFDSVDMNLYDKLIDYSLSYLDLTNGHAGNLIKNLKAFMNWAADRSYHKNFIYKLNSFKKPTGEGEIIFLTEDEVEILCKTEMPNLRLERVKDIFCFACFTGLRFGDIRRLTPANILEKKFRINNKIQSFIFLEILAEKTSEYISQPLDYRAYEIIKKYENQSGKCFKMISEDKTNDYLKEVAKEAELNRVISKTRFQGSKKEPKQSPLHEEIHFHLSKKTYMTSYLTKGGDLLVAMSNVGNRDYRTARRYYKVVDERKVMEHLRINEK